MAWPVATERFSYRPKRPMYGSPSGEQGRKPAHGCTSRKSSALNSGRYFGTALTMPRTRDGLIERSVPVISIVPPNRSAPNIGVTATRASDRIIACCGFFRGRCSVRL